MSGWYVFLTQPEVQCQWLVGAMIVSGIMFNGKKIIVLTKEKFKNLFIHQLEKTAFF